MAKLPPNPVGVPPGSSYWNDWYEKLRTLVDEVTASVGTGDLVRENGPTINNVNLTGFVMTSSGPGITQLVLLARLTGAGTDGSINFQDGIAVGYVAPT